MICIITIGRREIINYWDKDTITILITNGTTVIIVVIATAATIFCGRSSRQGMDRMISTTDLDPKSLFSMF